jgi:hypothetical protein
VPTTSCSSTSTSASTNVLPSASFQTTTSSTTAPQSHPSPEFKPPASLAIIEPSSPSTSLASHCTTDDEKEQSLFIFNPQIQPNPSNSKGKPSVSVSSNNTSIQQNSKTSVNVDLENTDSTFSDFAFTSTQTKSNSDPNANSEAYTHSHLNTNTNTHPNNKQHRNLDSGKEFTDRLSIKQPSLNTDKSLKHPQINLNPASSDSLTDPSSSLNSRCPSSKVPYPKSLQNANDPQLSADLLHFLSTIKGLSKSFTFLPAFLSSYTLHDPLGVGATSFVLSATRFSNNLDVAVKFLFKDRIPAEGWKRDRGLRKIVPVEVFVMRRCEGRGIVKFYELFEDNTVMSFFLNILHVRDDLLNRDMKSIYSSFTLSWKP